MASGTYDHSRVQPLHFDCEPRLTLGKGESEYARACADRDVLFAFEGITDRRCDDRSASLEAPQNFAGAGVKSDQIPEEVADEDQSAGGCQGATGWAPHHFKSPTNLTGRRIHRYERSLGRLAMQTLRSAQLIPFALDELILALVVVLAALGTAEVIQSRQRTISGSLPIVTATHAGAHLVSRFRGILTCNQTRPAIRVDSRRPTNFCVRARK